jgi:hypothetical protein
MAERMWVMPSEARALGFSTKARSETYSLGIISDAEGARNGYGVCGREDGDQLDMDGLWLAVWLDMLSIPLMTTFDKRRYQR